jgi:rSAM/selenodomain-associated transferase 2
MSATCRFSIVIPVLNEADRINALIGHLRGLPEQDKIEIIVVDGGAQGDTIGAVTDRSVRCLSSAAGRAGQMNAGAAAAMGEVLIFLHADTRLPGDAPTLIDYALGRPGIVGGAFDLGIRSDRPALKLIAAVASRRSRLTRIPYGDQAIFLRRDYFQRIGGWPDIPLMEDVALMRQIKKSGERIFIIPRRVSTSPRRWEKEGIVRATLRNWILLGSYYLGVAPERLARHYRSGSAAYEKNERRWP